MNANPKHSQSGKVQPAWASVIRRYSQPELKKAMWQLIDTFLPYFALWGLMIYFMHNEYSYWIVLGLAILAGLFLVRIFIFFHDCCHGCFFKSRRANNVLGYISGVLTFTPYSQWRSSHAKHHMTAGDLDRRGSGDVWTLTIDEYLNATKWKQLIYRCYRNPVFMFIFGPVYLFLIGNRFNYKGAKKHERNSVIYTNLGILAIILSASAVIGLLHYVAIQLPIIFIAGAIGIWLFYIQHQFEGVYWARHDEWDHTRAALEGSSYYRLPKVLQWFSGNIGLHHIHHIRPSIPNYNLQQCYDDIFEFQQVQPLTLRRSLKSIRMNLWDEKQHKMVSFRSLKSR